MTYPQISYRVVLSRPFKSNRVQLSNFSILEVQLHHSRVARGENHLRYIENRLEIVSSWMIQVVVERFQ